MKLFGKKKKETGSKTYLNMIGTTSARFSSLSYESVSRQGYQMNPFVYSCINMKVKASQSIEWKLFKRDADGKPEEILQHPILELIKNPNPYYGFDDFIEWFILSLDLDGNAYTEIIKGLRNIPGELYTLRPDHMDIKYNSNDRSDPIKGYEQTNNGVTWFDPDDIMHLKNVSPLDDKNNLGKGQATFMAGARSGDQNNESRKWNVSLLQNGAVPSGIISSLGDTDMNQDEVDIIKTQFRERYAGADNAGEPLVLGYSKWSQLGMTAKDLDWKEGTVQSGREVCHVLGVPSVLVGDAASKTYNNYKEARKAMFIDTIIPVMNKMVKGYNKEIVPLFGDPTLYLALDLNSIDVIREERLMMWDKVAKATFMTENHKREAVGMGTEEGLDVYLWPMNIQVIPATDINVNKLLEDGDD